MLLGTNGHRHFKIHVLGIPSCPKNRVNGQCQNRSTDRRHKGNEKKRAEKAEVEV